jgi:hypothetical protein
MADYTGLTEEEKDQTEAVYVSILSHIDELNHVQQALLVLNWVKYVAMNRAAAVTSPNAKTIRPAFERAARNMAVDMIEMAEELDWDAIDADIQPQPCGECLACTILAAIPSEAPTERPPPPTADDSELN